MPNLTQQQIDDLRKEIARLKGSDPQTGDALSVLEDRVTRIEDTLETFFTPVVLGGKKPSNVRELAESLIRKGQLSLEDLTQPTQIKTPPESEKPETEG